jgi:membrane protein DedA with SNARE-associated domain
MFDWITGWIAALGAPGVALFMFLENVFPPVPSELVMPLAGFLAARGESSFALVVAAGTAGALAGAVLWYWIGRALGADRLRRLAARHGRWLTMHPDDIDRATDWFDRHGGKAVFLGRLVPAVRTLISVPAGVARMPFARFLAFSAAGTLVWTALLALAGYVLKSQYHRVADWLNPVSTAVVAGLAAWYLWRVVTWRATDPGSAQRGEGPGGKGPPGSPPAERR